MTPRRPASARELLAMAAVAVALRLALFLLATGTTGTGLTEYAGAADGYQYLVVSRAWLGDMAEMEANPYYRRLFPGPTGLVALLSLLGVPVPVAALLPSWLACGAAAALAALVFADRRVGWATATLTPSFIFSGSLIGTEALCLCFSLLGLFLTGRGRGLAGGLAFGLGGLCRPVAVFAMLGAVAQEVLEGRWRRAAAVTAAAGLTVAAGLAAVQWRFGDALMNVRRYSKDFDGEILIWPFQSLVMTPLNTDVAAWKVAYVAAHLAAALGGCVLAFRELRSSSGSDRGPALRTAIWLGCNTLYVLCIGGIWGFHDFPRFLIPALPPLFQAWRSMLPSRPWIWLGVGALSLALALPPARRRLLEPQHSAAASIRGPAWLTPGARR